MTRQLFSEIALFDPENCTLGAKNLANLYNETRSTQLEYPRARLMRLRAVKTPHGHDASVGFGTALFDSENSTLGAKNLANLNDETRFKLQEYPRARPMRLGAAKTPHGYDASAGFGNRSV